MRFNAKNTYPTFGMLRAWLKSAGNLSTRLRKYCMPERTYSAWGGAIRRAAQLMKHTAARVTPWSQ
jgi:hypothetical protein